MSRRGPAITRECRHKSVRHKHGDVQMYKVDRCRCDLCSAASTADRYRYRKARARRYWSGEALWVPSLGVVRRFEALLALGWTAPQLATELGMDHRALNKMHDEPGQQMRRAYAEQFVRLFDRLSMSLPPAGWVADRQRRNAAKKGYAPPLAWDDIDDPAEEPQHLVEAAEDLVDEVAVLVRKPSNRAEVVAVIEDMIRRGLPDNRISLEVGRNAHTVAAVRRRLLAEAEGAAA